LRGFLTRWGVTMQFKFFNGRDRSRNISFAIFVLPALIVYLIFFIVPLVGGIWYSLTDYNGIQQDYQFVGFSNYTKIFSSSRFLESVIFSLKYSIGLMLFTTLISLGLALLLNKALRGRSFFRSLYFFPAVLSTLTVGLVFNEIFARALPQLGEQLGITALQTSLLSKPETAIWGVLIVAVWQGVAIPTVLFLTGLQVIPHDLYEASALDGATAWQQFRYITVPYLLPILSIVFVLTLKDGLTAFDYIMAMTKGGPMGSTESIAMLIYNHGFVEGDFSAAVAESVMLAIFICVISFVQIGVTQKKRIE